jgi:hypothetical protein
MPSFRSVSEFMTAQARSAGRSDLAVKDDSEISTTCETCSTAQTLAEAQRVEIPEAGTIEYRCKQGCEEPLAILREVEPDQIELDATKGLNVNFSPAS